jgi:hypothetical protein
MFSYSSGSDLDESQMSCTVAVAEPFAAFFALLVTGFADLLFATLVTAFFVLGVVELCFAIDSINLAAAAVGAFALFLVVVFLALSLESMAFLGTLCFLTTSVTPALSIFCSHLPNSISYAARSAFASALYFCVAHKRVAFITMLLFT